MLTQTAHDSSHRLSVAPMMDRTDRHFRMLMRLIAPPVRLYTEMVTAQALLHGDADQLLAHSPEEQPLALQLGGSSPAQLASATRLGVAAGYAEVNLNCGCPSSRVTDGRFGACLMNEPALVAECVAAMREAAGDRPVTVKTRIGVDERDSYEALLEFIAAIRSAGTDIVILHARKAWLHGLSPKQNREIPPLRYDVVYRLKQDFPTLTVIINGGIVTVEGVAAALSHVDGVMVGRAAYDDPWMLHAAATFIDGSVAASIAERRLPVLQRYAEYAEAEHASGVPSRALLRHVHGLYRGEPGSRPWRRSLADAMQNHMAPAQALEAARLAAESAAEAACQP
jgi:tRNA-dihydrouridine synthase A